MQAFLSSQASKVSQAASSVVSSVTSKDVCSDCGAAVRVASSRIGVETFKCCHVCNEGFCGKCSRKPAYPIPSGLVHVDWKESKSPWLCDKICKPLVEIAWMDEFQEAENLKIDTNICRYFSNDHKFLFLYDRPGRSEDGLMRQGLRIFQVAEVAAQYTGFKTYLKAAKYAYGASEFYNMILAGELLSALGPIMGALTDLVKQEKEMGVSAVARLGVHVYYLAAKHKLDLKIDPSREYSGFAEGRPGVLKAECPIDLLDYAGRYMDAAQWLYSASLPKPHDDENWSAWYMTHLIRKQGWTLLACSTQGGKLRNGCLYPAFALVARSQPAKEALLVIRGSKSVTDWSINLHEAPLPFTYRQGPDGATPVVGFVHGAMLYGALGILDSFSMRKYITMLIKDHGYTVKIVGHSLGAGTASLIAAELKNGFAGYPYIAPAAAVPVGTGAVAAKSAAVAVAVPSSVSQKPPAPLRPIPHVAAIAVATPACTSENIADALKDDKLVLSVVNGYDAVPRFSKHNLAGVVDELRALKDKADSDWDRDYRDLSAYVKSLGKAKDIEESASMVSAAPAPAPVPAAPAASAVASPVVVAVGAAGSRPTSATSAVVSVRPVSASAVGAGASPARVQVSAADANRGLDAIEEGAGADTGLPLPPVLDLGPLLVPPGEIIHLFKRDGVYQAAIVDHRHPSLRKLTLISNRAADEHNLFCHFKAFRNIRQDRRVPPTGDATSSNWMLGGYALHGLSSLGLGLAPSPAATAAAASAGGGEGRSWQSVQVVGRTSASAGSASDDAAETACWQVCSVCQLDPTWAYVTRSDATRAEVTHNCRACGAVVCSLCSPSGDQLPGDGVSEKVTTHDMKLPLPLIGLPEPQRVCYHCIFESYRALC